MTRHQCKPGFVAKPIETTDAAKPAAQHENSETTYTPELSGGAFYNPCTEYVVSVFSILFVCMGNIFRSLTAHVIFRQMFGNQGIAHLVQIDSASTHNHPPRSPADTRSQQHALKRWYDLSDIRAHQITDCDFETYDRILAMDLDNLALIQATCPDDYQGKVRRPTEFCQLQDRPVIPDPYCGGDQGFEQVRDLMEDAGKGVIKFVKGRAK